MNTRAQMFQALTACLLVMAATPAFADDETRVIDDKWALNFGGYLTEFKTDASIGSGGIIGTTIRAEDQLGLEDDQTTVRLDGMYRFNDRHAIGFGFWSLNREGATVLADQITFNGNVFDVGVAVLTEFDTGWFRVDYRYNLLRTDKGEAGFTAGISAYDFDVSLAGLATISGPGGPSQVQITTEEAITAPVPTVGFFINHAFTPKFLMRLKADFLNLEVSDFEGKITDTTFLFEYYFSKHVGGGLGINRSDIAVKNLGDDPFELDFAQSGFLGYLALVF